MLIKSYEKTYLEDVADNLGLMLEYAVACEYNPIVIWEMFVSSKVAMEIEKGNPKYLSGYSAKDYLSIVVNTSPAYERSLSDKIMSGDYAIKNDMYYWAGSAIARFQYESGLSFYVINKYLPIQTVLDMYETLHEADIQKFIDLATERVKREKPETNLKIIRRASGMTQQELAERSQVDLRSIQMYEQRRNDINKAQVDTVYKLARTLGCKIEDLLEF